MSNLVFPVVLGQEDVPARYPNSNIQQCPESILQMNPVNGTRKGQKDDGTRFEVEIRTNEKSWD